MRKTFTNKKVVEKVMINLLERFDVTVTSLKQVKDISKLIITDLVSVLEADE